MEERTLKIRLGTTILTGVEVSIKKRALHSKQNSTEARIFGA